MKTEERFATALINPATVFSSPNAVVDDVDFDAEQKIQILRRWEYDALEEQVAEEEGFPGREARILLDDVVAALHRLGTGPDIEHSPPTKQHGV